MQMENNEYLSDMPGQESQILSTTSIIDHTVLNANAIINHYNNPLNS